MENNMVSILLERYEGLLDAETRVDVAVDYICNDSYCDKESLLRILGTEKAVKKADEIKKTEERRHAEYLAQKEKEKKDASV